MCGIMGFLDKLGRRDYPTGRVMLAMLDALGCRGPDSAGAALIREGESETARGGGVVRLPPADALALERLDSLGSIEEAEPQGSSLRFRFHPNAGVTAEAVEKALGACRGVLEVLSLGEHIDLVK